MDYKRIRYTDAEALGSYLGVDRFEWMGGGVRKRDCPNCKDADHTAGGSAEVLLSSGEVVPLTSATCRRLYWRCPGCNHGKACSEYIDGRFRTEFVQRNGTIRRFVTLRDFADQVGVDVSTVRGWANRGRFGASLIRGTRYFIDTEKSRISDYRRQARHRRKRAA